MVIAFLGTWPTNLVLSIIVSNYLFKTAVEVAATPLTYRIVALLKTAENTDHYDHDTDFNPFSFGRAG